MQRVVAPKIAEFFSKGGVYEEGKARNVKTSAGEVKISRRQGKKTGLKKKVLMSPSLEKCCLRACAKTSFQQAEDDIVELMGIKVGHSTLHRLVGT